MLNCWKESISYKEASWQVVQFDSCSRGPRLNLWWSWEFSLSVTFRPMVTIRCPYLVRGCFEVHVNCCWKNNFLYKVHIIWLSCEWLSVVQALTINWITWHTHNSVNILLCALFVSTRLYCGPISPDKQSVSEWCFPICCVPSSMPSPNKNFNGLQISCFDRHRVSSHYCLGYS